MDFRCHGKRQLTAIASGHAGNDDTGVIFFCFVLHNGRYHTEFPNLAVTFEQKPTILIQTFIDTSKENERFLYLLIRGRKETLAYVFVRWTSNLNHKDVPNIAVEFMAEIPIITLFNKECNPPSSPAFDPVSNQKSMSYEFPLERLYDLRSENVRFFAAANPVI